MASANTMSMNFRDRGNELAVLKALGFRGSIVFGLIQVESLFICLLGGLLGGLGPFIVFGYTPLKDYELPIIIHLEIPWQVCAQALMISLVIGAAAAFWPSVLAYRLTAVQALRNME
jgi:putative ABC transport system permease protein